MDPIISLRDIKVGYQNTIALSNINLDIYQGEYIGIFGPNGSGKTSLLSTILGLKKPIKGTVKLFNSYNLFITFSFNIHLSNFDNPWQLGDWFV